VRGELAVVSVDALGEVGDCMSSRGGCWKYSSQRGGEYPTRAKVADGK